MGLLEELHHRNHSNSPKIIGADVDVNQLRQSLDFKELRKSIRHQHSVEDLKWKKRYYGVRTIWCYLTIILLGASLWFTFWLVSGVGKGQLHFEEYKTFLNLVAGTIIINVLGLVAIVMHFLFPKNGAKP